MEVKRKSFCMFAGSSLSENAKRSKMEDSADETFQPDSFIKATVSNDVKLINKELYSLKKYLTTKERVLTLLEKNKKCFHALLQYLMSIFNEKVQRDKGCPHPSNFSLNDQDFHLLTKEIISILANMCHLSVFACIEIRDKNSGFVRIYLYFLDKKEHLPIKTAILRLIGNLCELKETAVMIALNTLLIDKIVSCLEVDDQKTTEQSIRVLRLLSKRSQLSKSVLRSNGCLSIAKYIVEHKHEIKIFQERSEILQTLCYLFKFHPYFAAKQFAECGAFVQMWFDLILKFPNGSENKLENQWIELFLRCIRCSHELRSTLGEKAIDKVLELEQNKDSLTDIHCRFLCVFLEDSYFRLHMRYEQWHHGNEALNKILERLDPQLLPDSTKKESNRISIIKIQSLICESLCSLHYDDSLEFVIRHPNFISSVLNHIRCYLDQAAYRCQIEYITSEQRPLFPPIVDPPDLQQEDKQFWPLCKDFSDTSPDNKNAWSPAMSPSSSNISLSPNPSSPTFDCSPTISSPSSFLLDDYLQMNENYNRDSLSPMNTNQAPNEVEPDDPSAIDLDVTVSKENEYEHSSLYYGDELYLIQKLVHNEIRLIAHFSHKEERQSIFLINEEIIDLLIQYISEAPEMDNRLVRALRRLSRHQSGLPLLLDMNFQHIIISRLIRRDCLLTRYSRPCVRCDVRREFGFLLLSDHVSLADSRMGEYILLTRLDSVDYLSPQEKEDANNKLYASLMSALVLFRQHERRSRFFFKFKPIDTLFNIFGCILRKCSIDDISLNDKTTEAHLCCDIVSTLASIFPHLESSLKSKPISQTFSILNDSKKECNLLRKKTLDENSIQPLNFHNNKGELLLSVSKKDLCSYNEYFSGMFESEFIEKLEYKNQFIFDPEQDACSQEDFVKFLHFSIGCPFDINCTRVNDATTCASLLYLADKYLCTRLLDFLLSGGLAARLVTGQTLPIFLPLVLAIPTLSNGDGLKEICMLVLLRYSNNSELLNTLRHIANCDSGSSATKAIDSLMEMLQSFISSLSSRWNVNS